MGNLFVGEWVRLRAVVPSDWEYFYEWDKETEAGRLTDEAWFPNTVEHAKDFAEHESQRRGEGDVFRFMIERLSDGEVVGTLNTHGVNRRSGTFMYGLAIAPAHQRHGYGSEAIRLVVRYYFYERNYQKVNTEVFSYNRPSIHLHEKLGFVLEGRLRRHVYSGGAHHDALLYGMTREEFDEHHPT